MSPGFGDVNIKDASDNQMAILNTSPGAPVKRPMDQDTIEQERKKSCQFNSNEWSVKLDTTGENQTIRMNFQRMSFDQPKQETPQQIQKCTMNDGQQGSLLQQLQDGSKKGSCKTISQVQASNVASTKDWQKVIVPRFRDNLVHKIIDAIFPLPDPAASHDKRMHKLIAFAKKVESECYEMAISKSQYYSLIAEKIHKVQQELKVKRQKRKEQQMQQSQQSQGGTTSTATATAPQQFGGSCDGIQVNQQQHIQSNIPAASQTSNFNGNYSIRNILGITQGNMSMNAPLKPQPIFQTQTSNFVSIVQKTPMNLTVTKATINASSTMTSQQNTIIVNQPQQTPMNLTLNKVNTTSTTILQQKTVNVNQPNVSVQKSGAKNRLHQSKKKGTSCNVQDDAVAGTSSGSSNSSITVQAPCAINNWRHSIQYELRKKLVDNLVEAFTTSDNKNVKSSFLPRAKMWEKSIYEKATSEFEYYQMMADKVYETIEPKKMPDK